MEQQNQQPNQQLNQTSIDEQKRQRNRRIKIGLIGFGIFVLIVAGIFLLKAMEYTRLRPMEMLQVELCDLNADGKCGQADLVLFQQALGKKVGEVGYRLSADVDADGVITARDQRVLFPLTSQVPQQQSLDVSNWQTYRNEKYRYEIKYPSDWILEVDGVAVRQDDVPYPELGRQIVFFKSTVHEPYIWILPYPNPKQLSLKDHLIEQILKPIDFPTGDPKEQVSKMKPITVPGAEEALEESDTTGAPIVYLSKGSMTIMLSLSYGDDHDDPTKTFAKQTFYQILSTFRFVE